MADFGGYDLIVGMEVRHHNFQVKVEYQGHRSRSKWQNLKFSISSAWTGLIFLVFSQGDLFKVMVKYEGQGQCYSTGIFWTLNFWKRAVCSQSESISSLQFFHVFFVCKLSGPHCTARCFVLKARIDLPLPLCLYRLHVYLWFDFYCS